MHRQTAIDRPCFPPDRPAPGGARYHRAGEAWPLYASLEPATAWAEWRAATRGAVDASDERRRMWNIEVDALPVLDLRRPDVVEALDISLADLTGPRERAQPLAARARALGAAGIVAPSAARDGHWSLVVFRDGFDRLRPAGSRVLHPARAADS